jgi:thiol-disulfide isomerase/thioredoxin
MAKSSAMLPLGTRLPSFSLADAVSGRRVSDRDFDGAKAVLVSFLCNHCPYVVHVRDEYARLERDYAPRGVAIVGINSNDVATYPQDGPTHMKALAQQLGWGFPFLLDDTQDVARAFRAACTPEFYVFDADKKLVYRGQLDDSRPSNGKTVTGRDVRAALDAVLSGASVSDAQIPSVGCGIKWRA